MKHEKKILDLVQERNEFKAIAESLMEHVLALEWLVEVQEFQIHRLRNPIKLDDLTIEQFKKKYTCSMNASYELHMSYEFALTDSKKRWTR